MSLGINSDVKLEQKAEANCEKVLGSLFPLCSEEGLYKQGALLVTYQTARLYCHVTGIAWAGLVLGAVFPREEKLRGGDGVLACKLCYWVVFLGY